MLPFIVYDFISLGKSIEKLMKDFLWSGVDGDMKDHLVSWDLYRPKEEGVDHGKKKYWPLRYVLVGM